MMMHIQTIIALLSLQLYRNVLGVGKEPHPVVPHLSPSVFESLKKKETPVAPAEIAPVFACLPDYELINGVCVKSIIEPARMACIGGHLIDGRCQIALPYLTSCPPGYKLNDDTCSRIVETGIQFYCPKGFYDDGNVCAQSQPGEVEFQCDIGELVGDKCISRERHEYLIKAECPESSVLLEDGNCWKEVETYDCSEEPQKEVVNVLTTPKHHTSVGKKVVVQKGKHGSTRFRSLIGKEPLPIATTIPPPPPPKKLIGPGKEMLAVTAPQPTRVNVVTRICSKKIQVDAIGIVSCPPGFVDSDGHCLKETIRSPNSVCVSGSMLDGVCQPTIKRVPKHPGCPKGAYSAQGKCWMQEEVDLIESCPPTYIDTGDDCLGFTEDIEFECPLGLELVLDQCIGRLERPPFSFVPDHNFHGHSKKY